MSLLRIDEIFNFEKGVLQSSKCVPGEYDFITASSDWKTHNEYTHDCEALIFAAAASGSLGRTHYVNRKFISSDLCFIITPKDQDNLPVDLKFYHILFNELKDEIVRNTKAGTSKEAIGLGSFGKYLLPYFDIDTQIEIKNRFVNSEELKSDLSNELNHQIDLVKKLRQQLLQDAVQGKLVEQNPKDEPANELLKKIKAEKEKQIAEKKLKKEKELPPIKAEEIPFEIPENWVWCRLGGIAEIGTGATPLTSNSEYYENGKIPWITSSATNNLFVDEPELYITEKALKKTNCKVYPVGTLVIAMYGQGKTRGQITELNFPAATNQACATITLFFNDFTLRKYVKLFFQKIYNEIRELAQGGAQPNLNMGKVRDTIIPLPPLSEQNRIVQKLDELMQYCNELEASIKATETQNEKLLQQVLREALRKEPAEA
jgi:type I restriction enzyme, S subunit